MKRNMGTSDKTIRLLIAALIIALYFTKVISGTAGIILLAVAGIFVLTALVSFCPLYRVLGINTCPAKNK